MPVRVTNTQRKIKIPTGSLRKAARLVLSSLGYEGAELSVLVTGDRRMRALNRAWRGIDRTTDVLSFSMLGETDLGPGSGYKGVGPGLGEAATDAPPLSLGDIVLSAPRAAIQAQELGQSLEDELTFLLVHGILHLVGYDHDGPAAGRLKMERIQRKLIKLLTAAR